MRAIMFFVFLLLTSPGIAHGPWQSLAPGMDLGTFPASRSSSSGDSRITILRIDPALWSLEFVGLSLDDESGGRTARQWSKAHLRLHDLRHNYASFLINSGHTLYQVQMALGHSDPSVTMRYAHLSTKSLQAAADSASDAINAATTESP